MAVTGGAANGLGAAWYKSPEPTPESAHVQEEVPMASESLLVSEVVPAAAGDIFSAWLDTETHSAFTGENARIEPFVGGAHSAFNGYATGRFVRLEKDHLIAATWRTTEFPESAPDSHIEVTFEETAGGTTLTLLHTEIPDGFAEQYRDAWIKFYLLPLREHFAAAGADDIATDEVRVVVTRDESDDEADGSDGGDDRGARDEDDEEDEEETGSASEGESEETAPPAKMPKPRKSPIKPAGNAAGRGEKRPTVKEKPMAAREPAPKKAATKASRTVAKKKPLAAAAKKAPLRRSAPTKKPATKKLAGKMAAAKKATKVPQKKKPAASGKAKKVAPKKVAPKKKMVAKKLPAKKSKGKASAMKRGGAKKSARR